MNKKIWRNQLFKQKNKNIFPLKFGMSQSDVIEILGKPDSTSTEKTPLIFKYEDIELHFDKQNDYKLFLIYSDENHDLSIISENIDGEGGVMI